MTGAELPPFDEIAELAQASLGGVAQIVAGLSDADLVQPTGCTGWRVAELVVHLRLDGEAILGGLHTPAPPGASADRDFVTYWREWPAGRPVTFTTTRFHSAQAASYPTPAVLLEHFDDVVSAAGRAVGAAAPGLLAFQEHVISVADFLGTFVVELALHHLDLVRYLPDRPGPSAAALAVTRQTVAGLLGAPLPAHWTDQEASEKASGRAALDDPAQRPIRRCMYADP